MVGSSEPGLRRPGEGLKRIRVLEGASIERKPDMQSSRPILFTLLTACKNEEKDIRLALESALAQTYPHKEIIFVDDSTDGTKEIIRKYTERGVVLVDGHGKGCCMARNLGMQRATGEVIVFLTADTKLDPDYLQKIVPYYDQGYDWVTVQSYSYNTENVYSRFIEMQHRSLERKPGFDPYTTAGYSVRRDAAFAVGLISGGDYPVNTCRDWSLGKKLTEHGYKKMYDRSILAPHKSPDNLPEYWQVQKTRGLMSAYQPYFMFHASPMFLSAKFVVKDIVAFLEFALIVPAVVRVIRIARYSDHSVRDFVLFHYANFFQILARCVGEWQGLLHIRQLRRHAGSTSK